MWRISKNQLLGKIKEMEKEMAIHSVLGNPMDRGSWQATVHGVAKSRTGLSDFNFTFTKPSKTQSSFLMHLFLIYSSCFLLKHVRSLSAGLPWLPSL